MYIVVACTYGDECWETVAVPQLINTVDGYSDVLGVVAVGFGDSGCGDAGGTPVIVIHIGVAVTGAGQIASIVVSVSRSGGVRDQLPGRVNRVPNGCTVNVGVAGSVSGSVIAKRLLSAPG